MKLEINNKPNIISLLFISVTYQVFQEISFGDISFIGDLDIFPLIFPGDNVSITELTLILKIIIQCDVKHMLPKKSIISVLKVSKYIITALPYKTLWDTIDNVRRLSKLPLFYIYRTKIYGKINLSNESLNSDDHQYQRNEQ